jgi:hypothetical protein
MGEDFRLKWNDHHSIFFSTAESLCHGDHLTDVTLSCGPKEFSAHKLVLSICSTYFSQLFAPRPEGQKRRPADGSAIVYLKDVDPRHMELLLNYMYRGEINVEENELMGLLATAKGLQVKGLTDADADDTGEIKTDDPMVNSGAPIITRPGPSSKKRPAQASSKAVNSSQNQAKKIKEEVPASAADMLVHDDGHVTIEDEGPAFGNNDGEASAYVEDTEEPDDGVIDQDSFQMEDSGGESMMYEADPNNPGVSMTF